MKNASLFLAGAVAALCVTTPALATPLVTIRFDRANVNYEGALYAAANAVTMRGPMLRFCARCSVYEGATRAIARR